MHQSSLSWLASMICLLYGLRRGNPKDFEGLMFVDHYKKNKLLSSTLTNMESIFYIFMFFRSLLQLASLNGCFCGGGTFPKTLIASQMVWCERAGRLLCERHCTIIIVILSWFKPFTFVAGETWCWSARNCATCFGSLEGSNRWKKALIS